MGMEYCQIEERIWNKILSTVEDIYLMSLIIKKSFNTIIYGVLQFIKHRGVSWGS